MIKGVEKYEEVHKISAELKLIFIFYINKDKK